MREDYFVLPGRLLFEDIYVPIVPPKSTQNRKRYSAMIQIAKDSTALEGLFALVEKVGGEAWGAEAPKRLADVQACIDQGWPASKGLIGVQDGDHPNNKPERNAGFYLVTATRYDDRHGAPGVFGIDGSPVCATDPGAPRPGDGVLLLISVWAQPQYDRINFTLESIRKAVEGVPLGGGPSAGDQASAREAFASVQLPTSIAGVQPAAQVAAQAGRPAGWGSRSAAEAPAAPPTEPAPPAGRRIVKKL